MLDSELSVAFFTGSEFDFLKSFLADSQNDSFTLTSHDNGVGQENWVWVALILTWVLGGALFLEHVFLTRGNVVVALVDKHIHLLNEDTVGWDSITGLEEDNITNDKL